MFLICFSFKMDFFSRQYSDARKHRFAHRYVLSVDESDELKPLKGAESPPARNNVNAIGRRSLTPSITIGHPSPPTSTSTSTSTGSTAAATAAARSLSLAVEYTGPSLTVTPPHPHILQRIPSKAQQVIYIYILVIYIPPHPLLSPSVQLLCHKFSF